MKKKKILLIGGGLYARPFVKYGEIISIPANNVDLTKINGYDLIVFTGGHDVDPSLYDQETHITTISNYKRDQYESEIFDVAKREKISMVGICRGSQFLTVMNGGQLIQNVNNHGRDHFISTDDRRTFNVTSTHHQMMLPKRGTYKLIAWAQGLSTIYEGDKIVERKKYGWPHLEKIMEKWDSYKEPEVVWYEESKSLAVQYHPEYMNEDSSGFKYFQSLIEKYSFNQIGVNE